ncbi:MAG TPA: hypothetical protein VFZ00_11125 [Solirubrobacter sp.]|nr:hypothetical protein [Solirubrobacter sp.]
MNKIDVFWIVWCPNGKQPPKARHRTRDAAIKEAFRLARQAPGEEFFVMETCGVARKTDVEWASARDPDEEITF